MGTGGTGDSEVVTSYMCTGVAFILRRPEVSSSNDNLLAID